MAKELIDDDDSVQVSLKFRKGLKEDVARYAKAAGRNLNSQISFWAEALVRFPDLSLDIEKRAHALHTKKPPGRTETDQRATPARSSTGMARK